jgi:hypothetical protein
MPFVEVNVHNVIQCELRHDEAFRMYYIAHLLREDKIKFSTGNYRR